MDCHFGDLVYGRGVLDLSGFLLPGFLEEDRPAGRAPASPSFHTQPTQEKGQAGSRSGESRQRALTTALITLYGTTQAVGRASRQANSKLMNSIHRICIRVLDKCQGMIALFKND
jgi:hypothetical protein